MQMTVMSVTSPVIPPNLLST